ncbi:hypothetical protein EST38_g5793 [Candolleomyces aberdarensis]|uniref:DRBM domain-containing protein n=1 Tax=Candolleomyces aberdarensis TaxID=2316362 RepID=A0A4Q2DL95_9AGAR|nr:hypothetical protein EST38_g5793 [Candolleomyces aberdarensis]
MWCSLCFKFWWWKRRSTDSLNPTSSSGSSQNNVRSHLINDQSTNYTNYTTFNDYSVDNSTTYHQEGNQGVIFNGDFFGDYPDAATAQSPTDNQCYVPAAVNEETGGLRGGHARGDPTGIQCHVPAAVNEESGGHAHSDPIPEMPQTPGTPPYKTPQTIGSDQEQGSEEIVGSANTGQRTEAFNDRDGVFIRSNSGDDPKSRKDDRVTPNKNSSIYFFGTGNSRGSGDADDRLSETVQTRGTDRKGKSVQTNYTRDAGHTSNAVSTGGSRTASPSISVDDDRSWVRVMPNTSNYASSRAHSPYHSSSPSFSSWHGSRSSVYDTAYRSNPTPRHSAPTAHRGGSHPTLLELSQFLYSLFGGSANLEVQEVVGDPQAGSGTFQALASVNSKKLAVGTGNTLEAAKQDAANKALQFLSNEYGVQLGAN